MKIGVVHGRSFRQQGIASVEFAIGVVVLLVLMLVTAELGRAMYSYNTLTKTVRGAARYLSTVALDNNDQMDLTNTKETTTKALVVTGDPGGNGPPLLPGLTVANVTINPVIASGNSNPYVQVVANYAFVPIFASVPKLGVGGTEDIDFGFTMRSATTMRAQR